MARDLTHEERRDEVIAELTELHLGTRYTALIAGDENTIRGVCGSASDVLGSDESVLRELIEKSMGFGGQRVNYTAFRDLVVRVMRAEAEVEAIKEVEALEKAAKEDPDNCKPKGRAARWLQEQEERF